MRIKPIEIISIAYNLEISVTYLTHLLKDKMINFFTWYIRFFCYFGYLKINLNSQN